MRQLEVALSDTADRQLLTVDIDDLARAGLGGEDQEHCCRGVMRVTTRARAA
jgi:hypothetical protein